MGGRATRGRGPTGLRPAASGRPVVAPSWVARPPSWLPQPASRQQPCGLQPRCAGCPRPGPLPVGRPARWPGHLLALPAWPTRLAGPHHHQVGAGRGPPTWWWCWGQARVPSTLPEAGSTPPPGGWRRASGSGGRPWQPERAAHAGPGGQLATGRPVQLAAVRSRPAPATAVAPRLAGHHRPGACVAWQPRASRPARSHRCSRPRPPRPPAWLPRAVPHPVTASRVGTAGRTGVWLRG